MDRSARLFRIERIDNLEILIDNLIDELAIANFVHSGRMYRDAPKILERKFKQPQTVTAPNSKNFTACHYWKCTIRKAFLHLFGLFQISLVCFNRYYRNIGGWSEKKRHFKSSFSKVTCKQEIVLVVVRCKWVKLAVEKLWKLSLLKRKPRNPLRWKQISEILHPVPCWKNWICSLSAVHWYKFFRMMQGFQGNYPHSMGGDFCGKKSVFLVLKWTRYSVIAWRLRNRLKLSAKKAQCPFTWGRQHFNSSKGKKMNSSTQKRRYCAWYKIKRWLWKSTLSKRTQAIAVQATVESTMLFDSAVRPWSKTDINKMQSVVDKAYRHIWNSGRGLALIRMQETSTNSYQIRKKLGIPSIRYKIEKQALERIGHILRMPNSRTVKRVVLGHWKMEPTQQGTLRNGLISYWRGLVKEMGKDWTDLENLTRDRKKWKILTKERMQFIENWENEMCNVNGRQEKPRRSQYTEDSKRKCL